MNQDGILNLISPLLNVAIAFSLAGLVLVAIGADPFEAVGHIWFGVAGFGDGLGYTLFYTTNFIFTGLAAAIALQAGLFNIGGEGQGYVGGLGVILVLLTLDSMLPLFLLVPMAILAGAAFGAVWAFVPAFMQARGGTSVVITTIMFNLIAAGLMAYLLVHFLRPETVMQVESATVDENAQLPKLGWLLTPFGLVSRSAPLTIMLFVAILAAAGYWLLMWRTKLGYAIRVVGQSPDAAHYAGLPAGRIVIMTMMLSGALAGAMAVNSIMADQHRLVLGFMGGAGFVGVAIALMARGNAFGIVAAALLFGVLYQGGAELAFSMPEVTRDTVVMIQGLVILFCGAFEGLLLPWLAYALRSIRRIRPA